MKESFIVLFFFLSRFFLCICPLFVTQVLSLKPEMAVVSYSSECIISFGSIYVSHIPYEQLKKKLKL